MRPLSLVALGAAAGWFLGTRRTAPPPAADATASSVAATGPAAATEAPFAAFFDPVTGLPNETALLPMLRSLLQHARCADQRCALLRLDLLMLDMVRSVAGFEAGETVLRCVAERLRDAGEGEALSLGRGSFAVVLAPHAEHARVLRATQSLLEAVHAPITLGELKVALRCRSGVAVFPEHGRHAEALLRAADMACAAAHQRNATSVFYSAALEPDPRSLTLLADLSEAIAAGTLGYALQPKLDLGAGRFSGAELLVRWRHPAYGALAPCQFVPLAEKMGLVGEMSRYLVRCAAAHCREWHARGLDLSLSVNLSVHDLGDDELVDALIEDGGGLEGALVLEITETAAMLDPDAALAAVSRLQAAGLRISLDDFGTGHSSLSYLQRLAPDELKIDRSFTRRLLQSRSDRAIVRTSIQLAHDLGASVTAEGIEDSETLDWLVDAHCDAAQGFGIARPMAVEELLRSGLLGGRVH